VKEKPTDAVHLDHQTIADLGFPDSPNPNHHDASFVSAICTWLVFTVLCIIFHLSFFVLSTWCQDNCYYPMAHLHTFICALSHLATTRWRPATPRMEVDREVLMGGGGNGFMGPQMAARCVVFSGRLAQRLGRKEVVDSTGRASWVPGIAGCGMD
jgi:hypothetical protein